MYINLNSCITGNSILLVSLLTLLFHCLPLITGKFTDVFFSFLLPISLQPITVVAPKPTHHFLNDLYNIVDLGKGFRHFFFYWLHFTVAETEAWKDKVVFPKICCYLEAGDNLKLRCSKFTPQMPFSLHEAASEYFRLFVTLWLHLLSILNPSVNSICFCSLTAYSIYSSFCTVWPQLVITYLCYRTAKVLKNLGWCLKLPGLLLPWTQSRMLVWYWHKYKKKKGVSFLNLKITSRQATLCDIPCRFGDHKIDDMK